MKHIKLASMLFALPVIILQSTVYAETFRARIVKVEGEVHVVNSEGNKREPAKKQFLVNSNETVVTSKDSKAVMQFEDGAMSVLDESSSLKVEKTGWLSQLSGKVYYVFRKVFGKEKPKKVKTKFATIGIRGTTFIVDASDNNNQVALQEGLLNIESPGDDFEIHKPAATADEFAAFKQQAAAKQKAMDNEFSDYKKKIGKEFVEYKKSFDLKANKVVSFDGKRVNESELDNNWQSSFEGFAEFSKEYIDAYKELDQSAEEMDMEFK